MSNKTADTQHPISRLMHMDEQTWAQHAHPLSVWTRAIFTLPLLLSALWSIQPLGWWSLLPIVLALLWTWLNPRLFPVPKNTNNWASQVTFGERVWLLRQQTPIPAHHQRWANFLAMLAGIGFVLAIIGAVGHYPLLLLGGGLSSWFAKLWFCDRMVWLYQDMRHQCSKYQSWLRS